MKTLLAIAMLLSVGCDNCDYCWRPAALTEREWEAKPGGKKLIRQRDWCRYHWMVAPRFDEIDDPQSHGYDPTLIRKVDSYQYPKN